jgi:phenylpropionate dioxygenase-like ring-hydroxylating dioxygenase large terminal subunit
LVDAFCPHRRAPMFFGRIEECGLRCVYHEWKFDRQGCVSTCRRSRPTRSLKRRYGSRVIRRGKEATEVAPLRWTPNRQT